MHTVREFVEEACKVLQIPLEWKGEGREEHGINTNTRKVIVRLDERYLRTTEVDILQGDATRANRILNWRPKVGFYELVEIMAKYDLEYNRAHPQGIFID